MLINLLNNYRNGNGEISDLLIGAVFTLIVVLISLCAHEAAHGFAAYKLGDPTARNLGRLTMNPAKHLDPMGTVCMVLFGYGWAKPVPVNSRYFKKPRRDMAITAFAGPLMNLAIAFVSGIFMSLSQVFLMDYVMSPGSDSRFVFNLLYFTYLFFLYMHVLNIRFAVFNLIPVPPLDGSRILFLFLPDRYYFGLMKYERYIALAFLVLLYTGALSTPLGYISTLISDGFMAVISLIPGL